MAGAAKRMGLPMANSKHTSAGSHHAQQTSKSSSAIPDGPTPLAQRLGMPSANKPNSVSGGKDWSAKSSRINLGAPVYMKGKSEQNRWEEAEDYREEKSNVTHIRSRKEMAADDDLSSAAGASHDTDDPLFGGGDDNEVLAQIRAKRRQELAKESNKKNEWLAMGHGVYRDIDQDAFLKEVTQSKYALCHFYHSNFERCKIVDSHLSKLAPRHLPTKFIQMNAEKSPFFVGKLAVKMLPTIIMFKDGIAVDRVTGFEELGATDDFTTEVLEQRIAKSGILIAKEMEKEAAAYIGSIRTSMLNKDLSDDELNDEDEL